MVEDGLVRAVPQVSQSLDLLYEARGTRESAPDLVVAESRSTHRQDPALECAGPSPRRSRPSVDPGPFDHLADAGRTLPESLGDPGNGLASPSQRQESAFDRAKRVERRGGHEFLSHSPG